MNVSGVSSSQMHQPHRQGQLRMINQARLKAGPSLFSLSTARGAAGGQHTKEEETANGFCTGGEAVDRSCVPESGRRDDLVTARHFGSRQRGGRIRRADEGRWDRLKVLKARGSKYKKKRKRRIEVQENGPEKRSVERMGKLAR